jgi:hypothetical protein
MLGGASGNHPPVLPVLLLLEESLRQWHHLAGSSCGSQLVSPYHTPGGGRW